MDRGLISPFSIDYFLISSCLSAIINVMESDHNGRNGKMKIESDKLIEEYTSKLKSLKTYAELKEFILEVEKHDLEFYDKHNMLEVFDFTEIEHSPNRVRYFYDNGNSVGSSFVSNLYKVLVIG